MKNKVDDLLALAASANLDMSRDELLDIAIRLLDALMPEE